MVFFVFAKISGVIVGIQMMIGVDISETGIIAIILTQLANSFVGLDPGVTIMTTVGIPIVNLGVIIQHVRTAHEHRGRGILVSCGGFFSMLTIILGGLGGSQVLVIMGVFLIIGTIFGANYKFDD